MSDKKFKEYIEVLKEKINRHNYYYYSLNNSVISDYEYDKLFAELKSFEESNPDLITKDSPTQRVGEFPLDDFKQVEHKNMLLSLGNVFNKDELAIWYKKTAERWPEQHDFIDFRNMHINEILTNIHHNIHCNIIIN